MKEIWTKTEAEYHGEFVHFDPMIAGRNRCRNRTRRSMSAAPSRMARGARSAMATVGSPRQPAAGDIAEVLPNSARWRARPGATLPPSRSRSGGVEDVGRLDHCRESGVARVVVSLPSAPADEILPILDRWAGLIRRIRR